MVKLIRQGAIVLTLLLLPLSVASHPEGTPHMEWLKQQYSVGDVERGYRPVPCCDESDGYVLEDHEWRTTNGGKYQVLIKGRWYDIQPRQMRDTTKGGPNPFGKALLWYKEDINGVGIYCFAPGFQG